MKLRQDLRTWKLDWLLGIALIEAVDGALGLVTADAASDTISFYEAAGARGVTVVVPPTSTANVSRHGPVRLEFPILSGESAPPVWRRKAVSTRMKRFWAEKRKGQKAIK